MIRQGRGKAGAVGKKQRFTAQPGPVRDNTGARTCRDVREEILNRCGLLRRWRTAVLVIAYQGGFILDKEMDVVFFLVGLLLFMGLAVVLCSEKGNRFTR
ncbi:MAG: hypothetical protein M0C28_17050 [Candidatus Moduliflexus flocculans]|nr:hypothetical protein [Candidatus Moduliflexus flocculans]